MTHVTMRRIVCGIAILCALDYATALHAQLGVGTWTRMDGAARGMTMTVEMCCGSGRRLVYHIPVPNSKEFTMSVDSPMDGSEVPVLLQGKPSGETMAITRVDERHLTTVLKMNGTPFGTSTSTLSADGKTLTVESNITFAAANQTLGKQTETWVRK